MMIPKGDPMFTSNQWIQNDTKVTLDGEAWFFLRHFFFDWYRKVVCGFRLESDIVLTCFDVQTYWNQGSQSIDSTICLGWVDRNTRPEWSLDASHCSFLGSMKRHMKDHEGQWQITLKDGAAWSKALPSSSHVRVTGSVQVEDNHPFFLDANTYLVSGVDDPYGPRAVHYGYQVMAPHSRCDHRSGVKYAWYKMTRWLAGDLKKHKEHMYIYIYP